MSKVKKENGENKVVKKVVALAIVCIASMQCSSVYALKNTTKISNLRDVLVPEQAKVDVNVGRNKLEIYQTLLNSKNVKLTSIEEDFNQLGNKQASNLRFEFVGGNTKKVSAEVKKDILKEESMKKLIKATDKHKVSLVEFEFRVADDEKYEDLDITGCQFINVKNVDTAKLDRDDAWFVQKLKWRKVSAILRVNSTTFYRISNNKDKTSIKEIEKTSSRVKCLNLILSQDRYNFKKNESIITLGLRQSTSNYGGENKNNVILSSAYAHKGSSSYNLSTIVGIENIDSRLRRLYKTDEGKLKSFIQVLNSTI